MCRVTTHRAVDSIGEKQIPVEDENGKASVSLYQLDGVIYLALPVYYISDPATIVEATSFPYPDRYYLNIAESQKLELSETCLYKPVDEYDLMAWNSEFKTAFRYQRCKHAPRHYNEATFPKSKAKLLDRREFSGNIVHEIGISREEGEIHTRRNRINKVAHVVSYPFYVVDVGLDTVINPIFWILVNTPANVYGFCCVTKEWIFDD